MKRLLYSFICMVFIASTPLNIGKDGQASAEEKEAKEEQPAAINLNTFIEPFYNEVLQNWEADGKKPGKDVIEIQAFDFSNASDENAISHGSYAGKDNVAIWSDSSAWAEYVIDVKEAGLYELSAEYRPFTQEDGGSRQAAILGVQINGSHPYRETRSIQLRRQYQDKEAQFDSEGNQIRSLVEDITEWSTALFRSPGVSVDPLLFYLEKGKNTIRLQPMREGLAIGTIKIQPPTTIPNYEEVKGTYPDNAQENGETITIEAEQFSGKNSTSIQVQYNRDPLTTPESLKKIKFNTIGGGSWYDSGQTITWEFDVPESGEYKLGFRGLQNYRKNLAVFRTLYIDGEIPFEEMKHLKIPYASKWQELIVKDDNEKPYSIYLEKGTHTLSLEVTYEPFMPIIVQIEELADQIKAVSQEIQIASGNRIDEFRVWNVKKELPGLIEQLEVMHDQFDKLAKETIEINGERSNVSQAFESIVQDISVLLEKPNDIPNNQVRIGAMQEKLETQRTELMNSPLEIDKFYLTPNKEEFPRMTANFFEKFKGTYNSLIYSFSDKNQLREQKDEELNVWMMWGRDYAEELQQLANQYFTPEYGIKVNVNLIQDQNLLILAKAAGIMPDVALGVPSGMPFEMALRGAAKDFSQLSGSEEVLNNYAPGTLLPYYYDGGYYGIPETINFKVLFYRKDILNQLDLEVPNTWDDVYDMIPTLLQNQYNFYADPKDFSYMLYQNGVDLYSEDGMATALDNPEAFKGFEEWTNLFNLHGMDNQVQSFYQQFRKGTMPIGIADFNQYMQLLVAAPEILDLWGIAPVPGHVNENGEIVRWAGGTGMDTTSMMLFNDTPEEKQELAWEFIKWYTSPEMQTEYGLNLEQFRGETFRWNSANVQAFSQMPWRQEDLQVILQQWKWVKDVPNVPGGYMTTRQLDFAWNLTVLEGENPRIELEKAVKEINRELKRKQIEFDLIDKDGKVLHPLKLLSVTEPWEGVSQLER
ncbi:extracellular solute-binding protein [Bacillus niameyensis]|uniref:extracellular solute-binding protein n=1 Tax=Bacillus niameyensis TaxID=1522308 RepID=UPI001E56ECF0|nr:extracellular solute-binding protein [Bacillus niameyensis]